MLFKFFKKIKKINLFIKHNKKVFENSKNTKKNKILVDQFNYYPSLIPISHFVERLKIKHNANVYLYETFVSKSLFSYFKTLLNDYLPFGFFNIYSSFGCNKKFYHKFNDEIIKLSEVKFEEITSKLKTKNDVLDIHVDNIYIGDLLYDSFLMTKNKPTLNIETTEFKIFLKNFLKLFYFWKDYFQRELSCLKAIVVSHDVYHYAIPLRFAVNFSIPCYNVGQGRIYSFSKNKIRKKTAYEEFPKIFENLKDEIKIKGIDEAEKNIKNKFQGNLTFDIMINKFGKKTKIPNNLKNFENKKNILIATHCFTDAVHAYGESIFPDFYEWLMFLGKKSEKSKFKWLLKPHPSQYENNYNFLKFFENKFENFILIPNNISNLDLMDKIFSVLTVYGSVGHEFPLFNIPVINASINNPHSAYNFNFHAKNINEYENLIDDIEKLKINSKEHKYKIFEYYYLNYLRDYYFFDNHLEILNSLGTRYSQTDIFDAWINEYSQNKKQDINFNLDKFIDEKKHRLYAINK